MRQAAIPFGGEEAGPADPGRARFVLLPVPYERTTTYRRGTAAGPEALLRASAQVECFDEEVGLDPLRDGVLTLPALAPDEPPEVVARIVEEQVRPFLRVGGGVGCLGGEHSISLGPIRAAARRCPGLGVLQIDAHPDLRDSYEGTRYGHGCVMSRVLDLEEVGVVVGVGLRALSTEEDARMKGDRRIRPFFAHRLRGRPAREWVGEVVDALPSDVYVTVDVDGLDPSVVPGTGTPEPGGLGWGDALTLLREVCRRRLVAFDVVELLPEPPSVRSDFVAARLVMKILAYATAGGA
ncbi:MAG: agmatinase family protein [Planctomycetota bacterium]